MDDHHFWLLHKIDPNFFNKINKNKTQLGSGRMHYWDGKGRKRKFKKQEVVKWVLKNINLIILQVVGRIMIYFYFL
jgi:hypothetical protein